MSLCNQIERTKEQIAEMEASFNKIGRSYFGSDYQGNISDNGLLLVDVDKLMARTPKEIWDDINAGANSNVKAEIEANKRAFGELTRKPESERLVYKGDLKRI